MSIRWRVKKFTIDPVVWTDITIPLTVGGTITGVSLFNSDDNDVKLRSDKNDSTTEKLLVSGAEENFTPGFVADVGPPLSGRWLPGDFVCSVLASAGVGPVVLTMIG